MSYTDRIRPKISVSQGLAVLVLGNDFGLNGVCQVWLRLPLKDRIPEAIHRRNKVVGHSVVPLAEMGACLVARWKMKCIRLLELRRS